MTVTKQDIAYLQLQLDQKYQELKELEEETWIVKDEIDSLEQQIEEAEGEDFDDE